MDTQERNFDNVAWNLLAYVKYTRGDPKITGIYFYYFLFCIFIELYISPLQSIVHVH
jgi:hypothetical protein